MLRKKCPQYLCVTVLSLACILLQANIIPPHFHTYYNEYKATIRLDTLEIMEGTLPKKQKRLVQAWAELHIDELRANWKMAMNGEIPYKIEPLR